MKILYCGDPHVVPSELEDCRQLIKLIQSILLDCPDALVCFLGDQHHTHGLVHLPVMNFWRQAFESLGGAERCIALVGNHDKEVWTGPDSPENVMEAYRDVCRIVVPKMILGGITFVSHTPSNEEFVSLAGSGTTLVCHQSLDGCTYENGTPIRDGVNVKLLNFSQIISGHIHAPQTVGKVWYPGAPRWRTLADARTLERFVWLVDHAADGTIIDSQSFSTLGHCRPIRQIVDTPDCPIPEFINGNTDWRIEIRGPIDYVTQRRKELAGVGRKIKTFIIGSTAVMVKESEGLDQSFKGYFDNFTPAFGTTKDRLSELIKDRLGVIV